MAGPVGRGTVKHREWVRKKFKELFGEDWDPVVEMAKIAAGQKLKDSDEVPDLDQRFQALKEVTPYVMAKLRSVEVTGEGGAPLVVMLGEADEKL